MFANDQQQRHHRTHRISSSPSSSSSPVKLPAWPGPMPQNPGGNCRRLPAPPAGFDPPIWTRCCCCLLMPPLPLPLLLGLLLPLLVPLLVGLGLLPGGTALPPLLPRPPGTGCCCWPLLPSPLPPLLPAAAPTASRAVWTCCRAMRMRVAGSSASRTANRSCSRQWTQRTAGHNTVGVYNRRHISRQHSKHPAVGSKHRTRVSRTANRSCCRH
jgi:hypothetical protein